MPTYDYECAGCGHRFEAFQSMSDDPLRVCPSCNKRRLKRLIGGGMGVIFKGSGFYVTDNRSSGGNGKKSEADSGGKGDTKPENKSESTSTSKESKSEKSSDSSSSGGKGADKAAS